MEKRQLYAQLYNYKKYPKEFEEYLFPLYDRLVANLQIRLKDLPTKKNIDLLVCLQYLVEEHLYNMNLMNEKFINFFMDSEEYSNHLLMIVSDKVFFNEYLDYKSQASITKYNPLISSLTIFSNFIMNKYEQIPKQITDLNVALKLDVLKKGFFMIKSIINLLCDGFETEAFSTWRTLHEIECVAIILDKFPYLSNVYLNHMKYNQLYRKTEKNEETDKFYENIKTKLKEHNLKSKDFKKYLEYGFLFSIENWENDYPEMKLNFRKGIQYVAELSNYSNIYEASSEIAHGSSLLIYSNKSYYCNLTLICLYETFMRMESIFSNIIFNISEVDSSAYFQMKQIYIEEFNKNLIKLKLITKIETERKKQMRSK